MLKNLIIKILEKNNYVNKYSLASSRFNYDPLYLILFSLQKKNYKIIQIGANDGVGGDPINNFIKDYNNKIFYLGFEPQKIPFNELKKNYQAYKNFYFIKQCVGKESKVNFYYLNNKYESLCKKMACSLAMA
jgi:hypothetical protein